MNNKFIINSIIYFKNCQEIIKYIDSLVLNTNFPLESFFISITVNSVDDELNLLEKNLVSKNLNFSIYFPKENIGYLNGLIKGVLNLFSNFKIDLTKLGSIIFSNTDLEFSGDFLYNLSVKSYPENIGVIGPDIFSSLTKSHSNPSYENRSTKFKLLFLRLIFSLPIINYIYYNLSYYKNKIFKLSKTAGEVYQVHGAIFILKPELFFLISNFDTYPLLFSEESIVSEIAHLNKYKVFYDLTLKVVHNENSTISNKSFSFIFKNYVESLDYVIKKFY
jgi:hypothetical protein